MLTYSFKIKKIAPWFAAIVLAGTSSGEAVFDQLLEENEDSTVTTIAPTGKVKLPKEVKLAKAQKYVNYQEALLNHHEMTALLAFAKEKRANSVVTHECSIFCDHLSNKKVRLQAKYEKFKSLLEGSSAKEESKRSFISQYKEHKSKGDDVGATFAIAKYYEYRALYLLANNSFVKSAISQRNLLNTFNQNNEGENKEEGFCVIAEKSENSSKDKNSQNPFEDGFGKDADLYTYAQTRMEKWATRALQDADADANSKKSKELSISIKKQFAVILNEMQVFLDKRQKQKE